MSMEITTGIDIEATPDAVWSALSAIESHVDWMSDAVAIRFVSEQRTGVGTSFDCETRAGPFKTVDRMTVTSWDEGYEIGVRHSGLVTGTGSFRMTPVDDHTQRVSWTETLRLPLHFGGVVGEQVARPLLTAMWRRNLRNFKRSVEAR
jgi:hypothetical protein